VGLDDTGTTPAHVARWREEQRAFVAQLPRLEKRLWGRWVAVHRGKVIGSDLDAERLFERMWKKLGGATPLFIGRVGGPEPIVDMPGFDLS
jgi:hypothetical protein